MIGPNHIIYINNINLNEQSGSNLAHTRHDKTYSLIFTTNLFATRVSALLVLVINRMTECNRHM